MRLKDGFVLRDVAGQTVVIATGEASEHFHGMIKLNDTGKAIWQGLAAGKTEAEIAADLTHDFDVDESRAASDVKAFVERMNEQGFLA